MNEDVTVIGNQGLSDLFGLAKSATIGSPPNCNSCLDSKSMTLEERLEMWIEARCHEKNPQPRRVAELNTILLKIYQNRRFWQYRTAENRGYYEDALSKMWLYFCNNLCEVETARTSGSFLETCHYALGRLLINLKGHLTNIQKQLQIELGIFIQPGSDEDDVLPDIFDRVPNPEPELLVRQFDALVELLEADPNGELTAETNTLRGKTKTTQEPYALTAQTYLLMRYRDDMTIQQIADRLNIPYGTLQGGGKPAKWKALARKYAQMAIDEVSE